MTSDSAPPLANTAVTAGSYTGTSLSVDAQGRLIAASSVAYLPLAGVTDGSNAPAGDVGEYLSSVILIGAGQTLTSNTVTNIASLVLPAGDWDFWGEGWFSPSAPTMTFIRTGISTVNNTFASTPADATAFSSVPWVGSAPGVLVVPISVSRVSIASPTTYFLNSAANVSAGSVVAYGRISARRRR